MRRARKTLTSLREREQRRTRDPVPAALLAKYLRLRPRPNEANVQGGRGNKLFAERTISKERLHTGLPPASTARTSGRELRSTERACDRRAAENPSVSEKFFAFFPRPPFSGSG